jgi:hypothetical protein
VVAALEEGRFAPAYAEEATAAYPEISFCSKSGSAIGESVKLKVDGDGGNLWMRLDICRLK